MFLLIIGLVIIVIYFILDDRDTKAKQEDVELAVAGLSGIFIIIVIVLFLLSLGFLLIL